MRLIGSIFRGWRDLLDCDSPCLFSWAALLRLFFLGYYRCTSSAIPAQANLSERPTSNDLIEIEIGNGMAFTNFAELFGVALFDGLVDILLLLLVKLQLFHESVDLLHLFLAFTGLAYVLWVSIFDYAVGYSRCISLPPRPSTVSFWTLRFWDFTS